ncbi:thiopurine S-methyltransferase [Stutzerimonas tarimensis]|uniref:Thiopurine S-methyltransferase n=1 Tax=Stutzerimonas tarimensis TaxID=1507735 RepID=A0ABV7T887_9GAMM
MDAGFWQARWQRGLIGFHQPEVNPYLTRHWGSLWLDRGARVLVPLCGKSLDMSWLAAEGAQVLGIELSEIAVRDFFAEQGMAVQAESSGAFQRFRAGSVEILQGDIFALESGDVLGLYDRAALIALPGPMRANYAGLLNRLLPVGCRGLLITLDYDQSKMEGPPFAVGDDEVRRLFAGHWQIEPLEARDILGESPRFAQCGVTCLEERVYRLDKQR